MPAERLNKYFAVGIRLSLSLACSKPLGVNASAAWRLKAQGGDNHRNEEKYVNKYSAII